MRARWMCVLAALVVVVAGVAGAPALAQTTGTIEGTITDSGGVSLPGVGVEIKSPSLIGTRGSVTDAAGHYRFPAVPPGTYTDRRQQVRAAQHLAGVREERAGARRGRRVSRAAHRLPERVEEPVVQLLRGALQDHVGERPEERRLVEAGEGRARTAGAGLEGPRDVQTLERPRKRQDLGDARDRRGIAPDPRETLDGSALPPRRSLRRRAFRSADRGRRQGEERRGEEDPTKRLHSGLLRRRDDALECSGGCSRIILYAVSVRRSRSRLSVS